MKMLRWTFAVVHVLAVMLIITAVSYGQTPGFGSPVVNTASLRMDRLNGPDEDVNTLFRLSKSDDQGAPINDLRFQYPNGIDTDKEGNLYIADSGNDRVVKMTASGKILAVWGGYGQGEGQMHLPMDVAVDRTTCTVYVADAMNHRIQKFSCDGGFLATWGKKGGGESDFNAPHGVYVDDAGTLYVADTANHRVKVMTADGSVRLVFGKLGGKPGEMNFPHDVATDRGGSIYVTDFLNHRIQVFGAEGQFRREMGRYGKKAGEFEHPWGIAVDNKGRVWATDMSNHRLQILAKDGTSLQTLGKFTKLFGGARAERARKAVQKGVALAFDHPKGLTLGSDGKLYIAHPGAHAVDRLETRLQ